MPLQSPSGTLVIQPLPGIGDMLWHVRILRALARESPEGQITLLTKQRSHAHLLLGHEDMLKETLWLNPSRHFGLFGSLLLAKDLKPERFHKVYIFHHSPRYALAAALAGIPERYGYGFGASKFFLNCGKILSSHYRCLHPIERFEGWASLNGLTLKEEDHFITPVPSLVDPLKKRFEAKPKPWIVLGFGASDPLRQLAPERFAELAFSLKKKVSGTVFLCGSSAEKALGERIQAQVQSQGVRLELITSLALDETIAFLSQIDLFVGNDSGLLNIVGALKVPAVGLFMNMGPQIYRYDIFKKALNPDQAPQENLLAQISIGKVLELVEKNGLLNP